MFVGVLRLTLHLPEPGSLKSKRHVIRSAVDRVRAKFNVSIAEVAENDLWQKSVIGVAAVGNDHGFVNEVLDKVADFVASMHGGQILVTCRDIEIVPYGDGIGDGEMRTLAEAEGAPSWRAAGGEAAPSSAAPRPRPRPRFDEGEVEDVEE
jgi:uncharacterized protein YlxP (DUF503 family)